MNDCTPDPLPNFDDMSINRLRHWAEDVADDLYDYKQIKETLIINCRHLLGEHGASYDENKTVLYNMVDILEVLTAKIKELTTD